MPRKDQHSLRGFFIYAVIQQSQTPQITEALA